MHIHGPGCLQGPLSRGQKWCQEPAPAGGAGPLPPEKPSDRPPADAPIRRDLVERVRREIEAGTYDTPDKFQAALEKMLRRLEQD